MVEPISISDLAASLELGSHELVSFVGGGGKTTALFALGRQLPGTVVLTTTTKMGRDRTGGRPVLFSPTEAELDEALRRDHCVIAWKEDAEHKALGVDPETCDHWFGRYDHVVVEADGSRRKPFKAPRPYEPVIPDRSTIVVACVGAAALGRVIADQCQRPLRVAALAGCEPGHRLTPQRLAAVLESDRGSRKDVPVHARFAVLVNQVDDQHMPFLAELAASLGQETGLVAVRPFEPGESPE